MLSNAVWTSAGGLAAAPDWAVVVSQVPIVWTSALTGSRPGVVDHSVVGSYDGLSSTYDALHEWIHAQPGYDDGAGPWESYVDDIRSASDISTLRTEIIWPLDRG